MSESNQSFSHSIVMQFLKNSLEPTGALFVALGFYGRVTIKGTTGSSISIRHEESDGRTRDYVIRVTEY